MTRIERIGADFFTMGGCPLPFALHLSPKLLFKQLKFKVMTDQERDHIQICV
jgi:hypothetical protein